MKTWIGSGLALALLVGLLPAAHAQEAGGFFRFKQERGDYSHGVAVRWADPDNPGQFKIGVVLASVPLDATLGRGEMAPLDAIVQPLDSDAAALRLSLSGPDGELKIDHLFSRPGGFNTNGDGKEKIAIAGGRIKGSWKLPPKEFFDDTYEADFRFDLPLVELKEPGTPLPAGGGEPGKAYSAYIAALVKGDVEGVKKALGESGGWRFAWLDGDNDRARALEDEALHKPVKVTVSDGWIDDDRAMIRVEGPGRFGGNFSGRVMMQREDGAWRVGTQELR